MCAMAGYAMLCWRCAACWTPAWLSPVAWHADRERASETGKQLISGFRRTEIGLCVVSISELASRPPFLFDVEKLAAYVRLREWSAQDQALETRDSGWRSC